MDELRLSTTGDLGDGVGRSAYVERHVVNGTRREGVEKLRKSGLETNACHHSVGIGTFTLSHTVGSIKRVNPRLGIQMNSVES